MPQQSRALPCHSRLVLCSISRTHAKVEGKRSASCALNATCLQWCIWALIACAHMYTQVHTYVCTHIQTCKRTCMHTHKHTNMHTHTHTHRISLISAFFLSHTLSLSLTKEIHKFNKIEPQVCFKQQAKAKNKLCNATRINSSWGYIWHRTFYKVQVRRCYYVIGTRNIFR